MKFKSFLLMLVFVMGVTLTVYGISESPQKGDVPLKLKGNGSIVSNDKYLVESVPGDENDSTIEFLEIDEFEEWMEQQHVENQRFVENGDKSFYEKDVNGDYICREWTQKDADALYEGWKAQLAQMKKGYHFTKTIILPDGGGLVGEFDPETWNSKPESSLSSTIITLPDGLMVDLGHFDTGIEARKAVKNYLKEQVANGKLTQQEADTILEHGAIE